MSKVVLMVMVVVVGLWVVGQATNTKRMVEKRRAMMVAMVEVAGK